ncbi:MAG TPA: hypothetical protein VIH34_04795 [Candidatus Bathyarchaeia archaeon]
MNRVVTLAVFNIRVLLGERMWFVLSWALFGLQLAIYGSLMSKLVVVEDYFFFYSIGLIVIIVFESSADLGRHFVEHAREGELPYFLSLPISRRGLFAANALYGATNTVIRVLPPLAITLAILGRFSIQGIVFTMITLFLLGLGISGIMISMSFIAFKSVDIYIALVAGLSALLIRFSTAFYPIGKIPPIYQPASYATPLTYGADLSRWVLGYDPQLLLNPTVALVIVIAVAVGTISLSMTIMGRIIEGVKAA